MPIIQIDKHNKNITYSIPTAAELAASVAAQEKIDSAKSTVAKTLAQNKVSGKNKLKGLGLNDDEIAALFGS